MAVNPFQLMQLEQLFETFKHSHPKFPLFFKAAARDALTEGTIVEITVKSPDGKEMCTNLKLNASDLELIQAMKQMKRTD